MEKPSKKKKQKKLEKLIDDVGTVLNGSDFEMIGNVFSHIMGDMISKVPPQFGVPLLLEIYQHTLAEAYGEGSVEVHSLHKDSETLQ